MKMKKVLSISWVTLILALLFLLSSLLPACAKKESTGRVVIGVPSLAAQDFDPMDATSRVLETYFNMLYDAPLAYGPDFKLSDDWSVVKTLETINDGMAYRFRLRQGVKFHNGDPLTAKDLKFSFERLLNPNRKGREVINAWKPPPERFEIEDDYTMVVYLRERDASLIDTVFPHYALKVLPKDYIEKNGDAYFKRNPIGSGPFKLVKHQPDEYMEFEAFADYWKGAPYVKTVVLRIIPEDASRLAMLKTGEIDIMWNLPPSLKKEVSATSGLRVGSVESAASSWGWFSGASKAVGDKNIIDDSSPLSKQQVRQALHYALDREAICKTIYQGEATPMVTVGFRTGFGSDLSLKAYPYDPAKAKQLLQEAGYANGFTLNIYTAPHNSISNQLEVADIMAANYKAVGIDAKVTRLDLGSLMTGAMKRTLPGVALVASSGGLDTLRMLRAMCSSTSPYTFVPDTTLDKFLEQARLAKSRQEYEQIVKQADKRSFEVASPLSLITANALFGMNNRIGDWPQWPGYGNPSRLQFLKLKE